MDNTELQRLLTNVRSETLEQAAKWCETKIPETGRNRFLAADIRAMSPSPNYVALKVAEAELRELYWTATNIALTTEDKAKVENRCADLERRVLELGGTL